MPVYTSVEPVTAVARTPLNRWLALLSEAHVSGDELARAAQLPVGTVQALLLEMEMSGEIASLPGGMVQRRRQS